MKLKNVDFNKPPKLLINGKEYAFNSQFGGSQKALNKGRINYQNVSALDTKGNQIFDKFLIFDKFARVEHYYGDKIFFLGFVKDQYGTAVPNKPKIVNLNVLDGKDWLTQSQFINEVFINTTYDQAVDIILNKIQLPFIKKGKMQFSRNNKIEGWNSEEVDAYSVLRFIERQSNTLLQILLEEDKTYSINFFSKSEIANPNGNKGTNMFLDTKANIKDFMEKYEIIDMSWRKNSIKDNNVVKVISKATTSSISLEQTIELSIENDTFNLTNNISTIDLTNAFLYNSKNQKIRKLKVITVEEIKKGRRYDIAFQINKNYIKINSNLLKSTNKLKFKYFPVKKGEVQLEDNVDQNKIAAYTKGTGIKTRLESQNDAGNLQHLIKYAKRYLELGVEEKLEITIKTEKAPWDLGQHVIVKHQYKELDGIYYVKKVDVIFHQIPDGVILSTFNYILTKTSDFEEHINFYDDQSYKSNPILNKKTNITSLINLNESIFFSGNESTETEIKEPKEHFLEFKLQNKLLDNTNYDEKDINKIVYY